MQKQSVNLIATTLTIGLLVAVSGCRSSAPIAVWKPPRITSAVGTRVAIAELSGPRETAKAIREQMLASPPRDAGRSLVVIDPTRLPPTDIPTFGGSIQLVSAVEGGPSDLTVAMAARANGIDFILRGEVLENRSRLRKMGNASAADSTSTDQAEDASAIDPDEPLRLSWRLVDVAKNASVGGDIVVVDLPSARQRYPDLALIADPKTVLAMAASRRSYELLAPSIEQTQVELAKPFGLPGSRKTRRGNQAARAGQWGKAEQLWREVLDRYPGNNAATHNLAVAAVAGQDFDQARELIRSMHAPWSGEMIERTLVWIELRQREYHAAFGLPDPPEGWQVTQPSLFGLVDENLAGENAVVGGNPAGSLFRQQPSLHQASINRPGIQSRATNHHSIQGATGDAALIQPGQ